MRYFHIPDGTRATIQPLIDKHVDPYTNRIITDSSAVYDFAINDWHKQNHRKVNHSQQWGVLGSRIHTRHGSYALRGSDGWGVAGIIFPIFPLLCMAAFGSGGACIILKSNASNASLGTRFMEHP